MKRGTRTSPSSPCLERGATGFHIAKVVVAGLVAALAAGPGCSGQPAPAAVEAPGVELPNIIPYLDAEPSPIDGQGVATITPSEPVRVADEATFDIVFTVGEAGVKPEGFVLLQAPLWWGWTPPQTFHPDGAGYVSVTPSFSDPSFHVEALPMNRVIVLSGKRGFSSGDVLTFRYGPTSVDQFAEAAQWFQIFVDADGDGHAACIADPPTLQILPRPAGRLLVHVCSQSQPGATIEVCAAPVDALGNWSSLVAGAYTLMPSWNGGALPGPSIDVADGDTTATFSYTLGDEGVYFFDVLGPTGPGGRSNVLLCQEGVPRLRLYFGDIHGHSMISDGTGTPADYYRFARDVSGLDIAALTDHADYGTVRVEDGWWDRIKQATNDANDPGRFVTFLGFEWTNWTHGHRNVYYRDGDGPLFRSIDAESDSPEKLWGLLEPFEAMTIAHHVGGGPVPTDWSIAPGPKERLVEICSIHGVSEHYGCDKCIYRPVKGSFVRDALEQGYRLGIIGGGDTHDGHPGQQSVGAVTTGIMGVYSAELTRDAVWDALQRRHVYATTGPKIILNFQVAQSPMGSETEWDRSDGGVPVTFRVVGCAPIQLIEVIRNGETVLQHQGNGVFAQFAAEDPEPPPGTSWYYLRVVQEDGNLAWSSPVWVTVK